MKLSTKTLLQLGEPAGKTLAAANGWDATQIARTWLVRVRELATAIQNGAPEEVLRAELTEQFGAKLARATMRRVYAELTRQEREADELLAVTKLVNRVFTGVLEVRLLDQNVVRVVLTGMALNLSRYSLTAIAEEPDTANWHLRYLDADVRSALLGYLRRPATAEPHLTY